MTTALAIGWAVLLVAGWAAHPPPGPVRVFPQGYGTWDTAVVVATWARHCALLAAAAAWVGALAAWGVPGSAWMRFGTGRLRAHAALVLGFGLLGFALLGCGLAGLMFPAVLGGLAAGPCLLGLRRMGWPVWRRRVAVNGWWLAFAAPVVMALPAMLAPETSWDAMVYHLRLPATFLIEHRHFALVDSPFSGYPGLTELHYLLGLALTGSSDLAKLQHAACWLLTARLLYDAVRPSGVMAARAASLLWLMLPLGIQLAGMAYVDLATAWLTAAAAALAFDGSVHGAAVAAGLALATKYTGGFAVIGLLALLPVRRWHSTGHWMALPAGVWLARNWLSLGNPVYPFATRWLGGVSSAAVDFWTAHPPGAATMASRWWAQPWSALVTDDGGVGVPLAPLWVAVAVFGLTNRRMRFVAAAGLAWLALRLDARFLLPLVPAALLAPGPAWETRACRAAAFVALVLGAPWVVAAAAHGSFVVFDTMPPALGLRSHADHLRNGLDPAPEFSDVAAELGRRTPPRARLMFLAGIKNYYVPRRCSNAHQHICPVPVLRMLRQAGSAHRLAIRLRQDGDTYLVDLARATTSAVEGPGTGPDEREARILVEWLRTSTSFSFRTGEAEVYALSPQPRPRRLGRVPLLEPAVVGRITAGDPAARPAIAVLASLAPESSSTALARGLAALLATPPRVAQAREELERAVRDPETSSLAWRGLGWAYDRTGEPGKALTSFHQAVALNPSDVDSRYGAGMIMANGGWWDQAAVELATALRLAPGRDDIRQALAAVTARRR